MSDRIEELKNIVNKEEEPPEVKRQKWSGFVESTVVNFFDEYKKVEIIYYVLTDRTTQSVVQKPRAKHVRLELKYEQHLSECNDEVQAIKK